MTPLCVAVTSFSFPSVDLVLDLFTFLLSSFIVRVFSRLLRFIIVLLCSAFSLNLRHYFLFFAYNVPITHFWSLLLKTPHESSAALQAHKKLQDCLVQLRNYD